MEKNNYMKVLGDNPASIESSISTTQFSPWIQIAKRNIKDGKIYTKMLAMISEFENVPKRGHADIGAGYDYAKEEDVLRQFRTLCIKYNIIVLPNVMSVEHEGKLTSVNVEYEFIDTDNNESITLNFPGQGWDGSDKGVYKAITGSYKYFMMKAFMIPTGDDPEKTNAPSPAPPAVPIEATVAKAFPPPAPPAAPVAPPPTQAQAAPPPATNNFISQKQNGRLYGIRKSHAWEDAAFSAELMSRFGVADTRQITTGEQYNAICKYFEDNFYSATAPQAPTATTSDEDIPF